MTAVPLKVNEGQWKACSTGSTKVFDKQVHLRQHQSQEQLAEPTDIWVCWARNKGCFESPSTCKAEARDLIAQGLDPAKALWDTEIQDVWPIHDVLLSPWLNATEYARGFDHSHYSTVRSPSRLQLCGTSCPDCRQACTPSRNNEVHASSVRK